MRLWEKYIFSQLLKIFLFFLFCLLSVYIIADLSVHSTRFYGKPTFSDISLYYLRIFATLMDLFLSLSFLLAILRVLFQMSGQGEFVALQMAGLSKKKLMRPFFLLAFFLSILGYVNSQWFAPHAREVTEGFYKPHKKKTKATRVYSLSLEDESELVYQNFDKDKQEMFDVFWVKNPQDIWHMKYLQLESLTGRFVHHFTRNENQQLEKTESFALKELPEFRWNKEAILHKFIPFDQRPISTLFFQALNDSAEKAAIFTHLLYKLLVPLVPFFTLFAIAPISVYFSRYRPLLLIAASAIFGLISLKVILDGMLLLGETQVLPAWVAIGGPIALLLFFSLPRFVKMQ